MQWFGRGVCAATVLACSTRRGSESLVTALWPVSRLLVVGDGLLAAALEGVARVLEWEPEVVSGGRCRRGGRARASAAPTRSWS